MKKNKLVLVVSFAILLFFSACSSHLYFQRKELILKGKVKEETTYYVKVKDNKIPADTTGYFAKYTMIFDPAGNTTKFIKLWDTKQRNDNLVKSENIYTGTGKNIGYTDISTFADGDVAEANFTYKWMNDYQYKIYYETENRPIAQITLDNEYRIIQSIYALGYAQQDSITNTIQYSFKDDKIEKKKTYITMSGDGKTAKRVGILVVKAYDKRGNPTILYYYDDENENQVKEVLFRSYVYY